MIFSFLWLKRFFLSRNRFVRFTPLVAVFSLILASSSLILALSVYSGYETTVQQAVVDMTGHLIISSRGKNKEEKSILDKIKGDLNGEIAYMPFLSLNSLLVYEGRLSGALLEGVLPEKASQVLNLKGRLIRGAFHLKHPDSALIGRGLAVKFRLKPGDYFHIVIPKMSEGFQSRQKKLYVEGILDLGFHDFNARHILVNIKTARGLIGQPSVVSGMRFRIKNRQDTGAIKAKWAGLMGPGYKVSDWRGVIQSLHSGYFEAVRKEKFLIFFILMVLVLAGAFNVSSHLSIAVLNQIREISILRVMGADRRFVFFLLLVQGLIISFTGAFIGTVLGYGLSNSFSLIQKVWQIIPSDVYKVNTIIAEIRVSDVLLVLICSLLVCLLSCVLPAWRALRLSLREGLLYD